jgi:hypothetical protein
MATTLVPGVGPQPEVAEAAHRSQIAIGGSPDIPAGVSLLQGIDGLEDDVARPLDSARVFRFWDEALVEPQSRSLDERGYHLFLSVRSRRVDGTPVPWSEVAAARPGDPLHDVIVSWATDLKSLETPAYFSFHHEPEIATSLDVGTAAEFVAAWRNVIGILRAQGVTSTSFVWVMTEHAFELDADDRRHPDKWYPGDSWVDGFGADAYNWFDCRPGQRNPWRSLEDKIEGFVQFGASHPGKFLTLPEFASIEDPDDPMRKARWLNDAAQLFTQPKYDDFTLISYYNRRQPGQPACDWSLDSSPQSLAAIRSLVTQPVFDNGQHPSPDPVSAPRNCAATLMLDGTVRVTWGAEPDGIGYVVYRNNYWRARIDGTNKRSFVDPLVTPGVDYSWSVAAIRGIDDAKTPARVCRELVEVADQHTVDPPEWCTATVRANGTTLIRWAGEPDGRGYLVARSGNQIARPKSPTRRRFIDRVAPQANTTWTVAAIGLDQQPTTPKTCVRR